MKCRPTTVELEALALLVDLLGDTANAANTLHNLGRSLSREQRGQLQVLIRVAQRTTVMLSEDKRLLAAEIGLAQEARA